MPVKLKQSAALQPFPSTTILTCYFHVMKNVRERLIGNKTLKINQTPVKLHKTVLKGVNQMHWSRNINEYTLNQNKSLSNIQI